MLNKNDAQKISTIRGLFIGPFARSSYKNLSFSLPKFKYKGSARMGCEHTVGIGRGLALILSDYFLYFLVVWRTALFLVRRKIAANPLK